MLTWLCFEVVKADTGCGRVKRHADVLSLFERLHGGPFVKDGPVYHMLKEMRKEALKQGKKHSVRSTFNFWDVHTFEFFEFLFREFKQLLTSLPHRYFWDISLSEDPL